MTHTNSKTWISPEMVELERWEVVKKNLERMRFDRSPYVPMNFADWLEHRAAYAAIVAMEEKRRLTQREALDAVGFGPSQYRVTPTFGGKVFNDNRSATLAQKTIWAPWYEPTEDRQLAPWPARDELKEEGDERHTSGFGRFLPIPRVPGNETVVWKQKAFVPTSPMDQVSPVPTCWWSPDQDEDTVTGMRVSISSDGTAEKQDEAEDEASTAREDIADGDGLRLEMSNYPIVYEVTADKSTMYVEGETVARARGFSHIDQEEGNIPKSLLVLYNLKTIAQKRRSNDEGDARSIAILEKPASPTDTEDETHNALEKKAADICTKKEED